MNTQPIFDGDSLPQVAMPFMNTVHFEELELVNSLLSDIRAQKPVSTITKQVSQWHDHTVAHFEREEHYMRECNFPPYPIHKSEHEAALAKLTEMKETWLATNDYQVLENYIVNLWRPWLDNHIGTLDFVTAQYFMQCGISAEL